MTAISTRFPPVSSPGANFAAKPLNDKTFRCNHFKWLYSMAMTVTGALPPSTFNVKTWTR